MYACMYVCMYTYIHMYIHNMYIDRSRERCCRKQVFLLELSVESFTGLLSQNWKCSCDISHKQSIARVELRFQVYTRASAQKILLDYAGQAEAFDEFRDCQRMQTFA